jgi:hypothetical protein
MATQILSTIGIALNLNFDSPCSILRVEVRFEDTSLKIVLAERFLRCIKWSDQNRPLSKAAYKDTEHLPRVLRAHFVGRGPQRYSGGIGGNDGAAICQNEKLFLQRGDENGDSYGPRSHAARQPARKANEELQRCSRLQAFW